MNFWWILVAMAATGACGDVAKFRKSPSADRAWTLGFFVLCGGFFIYGALGFLPEVGR